MENKKVKKILSCVLAVGLIACSPGTQDYDVVILNDRVMDPESNFDEIPNVGIVGNQIVAALDDTVSQLSVAIARSLIELADREAQ